MQDCSHGRRPPITAETQRVAGEWGNSHPIRKPRVALDAAGRKIPAKPESLSPTADASGQQPWTNQNRRGTPLSGVSQHYIKEAPSRLLAIRTLSILVLAHRPSHPLFLPLRPPSLLITTTSLITPLTLSIYFLLSSLISS